MMRQAGRYLASYRELKQQYDFWTMCRTPELAARVTMLPVDEISPDAAILFSDIMVVVPAMGLETSFAPGPVIANPLRTASDINALGSVDAVKKISFVFDAIRQIRTQLNPDIALIGFCGAPLTLAAYMVEGGKSTDFVELKTLLYSNKTAARLLIDRLVDVQSEFLIEQIGSGAQAVQIFDTWAGSMPREIVKEFVIPGISKLIARVKSAIARGGTDVPVIYFMKDAAHVLDLLAQTGADVISVDSRLSLDDAGRLIGGGAALQGNLDSTVLFTNKDVITRKVKQVLDSAPDNRGHIFNLGHGILPGTPKENAIHMINEVKRLSAG
jgi:uroporphyrinogen decarboxylase